MNDRVPTLTGPHVTLRAADHGDVDARFALGQNAGILKMYGVAANISERYERKDAENWVRYLIDHPHAWIIEQKGLIGAVRLDNVDLEDRRASLAIGMVDLDAMDKGYGTEAIRLVLGHAFAALGLHRVSLRVLAYNHRAIRAYEKCGFRREGRERETAYVDGQWHDDIIMGILEGELTPGRTKPRQQDVVPGHP
jgi:RimJ/RimL family protein N-acetyltransferase